MDYMPLKSVDVRLECKNLLSILKYPDDVHIVFSFDKVFDPELLIHIVLVVINSPHVKYFMTCRDSFTTQQHPCHLKGTRFGFKYKDLLKYLKFEEKGKSTRLVMNGSENAGNFTVYKVCHQTVDTKFLENLYLNFIERECEVCEGFEFTNEKIWKKEEEQTSKKGKIVATDPYPQSEDSSVKLSSKFVKDVKAYYTKQGDLKNLEEKSHGKRAKKYIEKTCIGSNEILCKGYNEDELISSCLICTTRFPSEAKSKSICHVCKSLTIEEKGLFASKDIAKGQYICKYRGQKVKKGVTGKYVAQIDGNIFVDATKTDCRGRYANHSCTNNCILQKVMREGSTERKTRQQPTKDYETELWIRAKVPISKGNEITFHYGESYLSFFKDGKCLCGECCRRNIRKRQLTNTDDSHSDKYTRTFIPRF
jgi:hypothetical protein